MDLGEDNGQKKFVNIIIESSLRATDLIRKLLTFGRMKPLNTAAVDVHTAIQEAVALLECSIDKKIRIEIKNEAEQSIVNGDLAQLQTVFINLGVNASHAMPDGGTITIESSCIQVDEFSAKAHSVEPGRYLKIQFRDTGTGINPEHLSRIFEPFFTTKTAGKGSGLGLSASFGIVKQHHGSISVYSEQGHGTVFNILLPLSDSEKPGSDSNATPIKGCGMILLIDDEKIIRDTAIEILERLGYEVIAASSASEGISIYRENHDKIKMILLDMIMPEMNGRECFDQLKKINPGVKVVLASGFSQAADFEQMQKNGLCGFIQKPYSLIDLSKLLYKTLNKG
jgi:CheY-like chemotaxis protein/anti-sigma regulatory factor (Ser/Thr protein kinase)